MFRWIAFVTTLLIPASGLGQDSPKQCVDGSPRKCVQPLRKGAPAPFDGQLYTPELALDHAEKAHTFTERLKLEIERVNARNAIQVETLQRLREIDAKAAAEREAAHLRALDAARPPWYERPAFVVPVAVVVTTAVILGAFALSAEMGQAVWTQ